MMKRLGPVVGACALFVGGFWATVTRVEQSPAAQPPAAARAEQPPGAA
jgi:hypothetical protein